jgi:hypothetical protein
LNEVRKKNSKFPKKFQKLHSNRIYIFFRKDLLEEYNRNVTFKYHHILKHLYEIMTTLRKEEVNRLSQIKQFLINLAKDVNELEVRTISHTYHILVIEPNKYTDSSNKYISILPLVVFVFFSLKK